MIIQLLYGDEFWLKVKSLISNAKKRIFIGSAFLGNKDYNEVIRIIPSGVYYYFATRDDSSFVPKNRCIKINSNYYHGKIYLIDDTVIIGSQNLYRPKKMRQGEYNVLFDTDQNTSSMILYQALLKISQQALFPIEPVNKAFLEFYSSGCPFCGNSLMPDPFTIYKCPEYGGGFVSDEDCSSYGNDGACKYCIPENRNSMGECYCCDHSGCGFGISLRTNNLIYHTIDSPDRNKELRAKEFIRLFNFLAQSMNGNDLICFYKSLGFIGDIYNVQLERLEWKI